ncbi:LacI family DNA-binding transcriptional regulator [candidate division KSB1 bacterium]|nr:LacI family DNA-binding transcriptional regulator [candidate division KSB1 bacterium]
MKNNITLKTIAHQLGISESTVSRVLNGKASKYRISKKTEEIILKTAKELNFTPNPLARSLRLNKTNTIGLVIPDISNPFFSSIARNVEQEARKLGYSIILCDTEEDTDLEKESLELLELRKVDGLIISPVGQTFNYIKRIYNNGMPIVIIDRYFPDLDIPYVTSDNYKGAFEAISYLIDNGHRSIACIQGLTHTSPNNERVRGYREALLNYHLPVDEALIVGDSFGEQNGYLETKLLLKNEKNITAIFSVSNLISLGALRAIYEEGLRVPEDISIISFDDQPYSDYLATPMTTVTQKNKEMGQISIKLLINQIESKIRFSSKCVILPTKLIKRKSVKLKNETGNTEDISTFNSYGSDHN